MKVLFEIQSHSPGVNFSIIPKTRKNCPNRFQRCMISRIYRRIVIIFLEHTILSITESANGIDNFNWAAIRIKDPDKIGTRVSVRSAGDNFLD